MNKLQLIIVLLTSIITIGQKNNFYGESGKQFYKLKIDKATYDLLTIQDGTVFFNNGIQGDCFYKNEIITIKNLFYPVENELRFQNDYKKQDDLNYILNKQIGLDIQISVKINKLIIITKPLIGSSKETLKELFLDEEVFRETSDFIWFASGIVLNFDVDGFKNIEYKKI